jgi:hypothetical protein
MELLEAAEPAWLVLVAILQAVTLVEAVAVVARQDTIILVAVAVVAKVATVERRIATAAVDIRKTVFLDVAVA